MSDVWSSFWQGEQNGERVGGNIRNAAAYRAGGLPAVAEAAGRNGDLATTENVREFQDQDTQRAYQRMEQIRPLALGALDRVSQIPTEQRSAWLNQPQIRQRFLDWGIQPQQYDQAVQRLSNPQTADAALTEFRSAFTQHQDPTWSIKGTQVVGVRPGDPAIEPNAGQVVQGGTVPEVPDWQTNGTTPYYVDEHGATHLGTGTIPRPPPAAMIVGEGNTPENTAYVADLVENQGPAAATPFFNRNPLLAQAVNAELARRRSAGDTRADPVQVGQSQIAFHALARSTDQLTTQANSVQRAAGAVRNNLQTAISLMRTLQNNRSPLINQGWQAWANATGDPHASDVRAARIALEGTMAEYARQVTGMYGAGSAPETEMRNYRDQLNQADNMQTVMQVFNSMSTLMDNVDNSYNQQLQEMRNGQGAGAGGGGAPASQQVTSQAQYDALPHGAHYTDSQGNPGVKP